MRWRGGLALGWAERRRRASWLGELDADSRYCRMERQTADCRWVRLSLKSARSAASQWRCLHALRNCDRNGGAECCNHSFPCVSLSHCLTIWMWRQSKAQIVPEYLRGCCIACILNPQQTQSEIHAPLTDKYCVMEPPARSRLRHASSSRLPGCLCALRCRASSQFSARRSLNDQ